jgi:hypothetical protein
MGADELALVTGEPVGTGGADLAVVVDRGVFGSLKAGEARRTILWDIAGKFIIENVWPVGKHG